jgi:DNA-binding transcriptional ArsR family regulator
LYRLPENTARGAGYVGAMSSADPRPRAKLRDPARLRALAHPARIEILGHLNNGGPATATECAQVVGLSPSATSYHLRALARAGLVQEAPNRGDGRERLWASGVSGYEVAAEQHADAEVRAAEDQLIDSFLILDDQRVRRYLSGRDSEPAEWYAVATVGDKVLQVTPEELGQLRDRIDELLEPYRKSDRTDLPDGTRAVAASIRLIPLTGPDVKR